MKYSEQLSVITDDEVRFAIFKVTLDRAIGVDNIPAEVLRYGPVHSFMVRMFNLCFQYGIINLANGYY